MLPGSGAAGVTTSPLGSGACAVGAVGGDTFSSATKIKSYNNQSNIKKWCGLTVRHAEILEQRKVWWLKDVPEGRS